MHAAERAVARPQIAVPAEGLAREDVSVAVLRRERREAVVVQRPFEDGPRAVDDLVLLEQGHRNAAGRRDPRVAAGKRARVDQRQEQRFVERERIGVRIGTHRAVDRARAPAFAARHVRRGAGLGVDAPDVVLIVNQRGAIAGEPAAEPFGLRVVRVIVFDIVERDAGARRHRHRVAVTRADRQPVPAALVPRRDVSAAGRERRVLGGAARHAMARAVRQRDRVEIAVVFAEPRGRPAVCTIVRAEGHVGVLVVLDGAHRRRAQLHEARSREVVDREVGPLALVVGVLLLLRLQHVVGPRPLVDLHRLRRPGGERRWLGRGPEEQPRAVLRERELAVRARRRVRRESRRPGVDRFARRGLRRAQVDDVRGVMWNVARVARGVAEICERRTIARDRYISIASGARRDVDRRSPRDVVDVHAVAFAVLRLGRVRDRAVVVRDDDRRHVGDDDALAADQVANRERRARLFLLVGLRSG